MSFVVITVRQRLKIKDLQEVFDRSVIWVFLQVKFFVSEMDQASSSSNMEEDKKPSTDPVTVEDNEEREAIEIALFQVPECYVYLVNF